MNTNENITKLSSTRAFEPNKLISYHDLVWSAEGHELIGTPYSSNVDMSFLGGYVLPISVPSTVDQSTASNLSIDDTECLSKNDLLSPKYRYLSFWNDAQGSPETQKHNIALDSRFKVDDSIANNRMITRSHIIDNGSGGGGGQIETINVSFVANESQCKYTWPNSLDTISIICECTISGNMLNEKYVHGYIDIKDLYYNTGDRDPWNPTEQEIHETGISVKPSFSAKVMNNKFNFTCNLVHGALKYANLIYWVEIQININESQIGNKKYMFTSKPVVRCFE